MRWRPLTFLFLGIACFCSVANEKVSASGYPGAGLVANQPSAPSQLVFQSQSLQRSGPEPGNTPDLLAGFVVDIDSGGCRQDYLYVSPGSTNLTISVGLISGAGHLSIEVCRRGDTVCPSLTVASAGTTNVLVINNTSDPPLASGLYTIRTCNLGGDTAQVFIAGLVEDDFTGLAPAEFTTVLPVPIADEAVTYSTLDVTNQDWLVTVEAGVRVNHPRISDLAFTLISPGGTRVILCQNRGGLTSSGMGADLLFTNVIPATADGNANPQTNIFKTGSTSGTLALDWNLWTAPDRIVVYYETNVLLDTGMISGIGSTNLSYGPGDSTFITIIVNPDGNPDPDTAWYYTFTSTMVKYVCADFTDDTNKTLTPIQVAVPPYTNANYIGTDPALTNGIFYLPEESLARLQGERANGEWRLEIRDTVVGATNPAPVLLSWDLTLRFENPRPAPSVIIPEGPITNTVAPGGIRYFVLDVPAWVTHVTNTLANADGNLNVWFDQSAPPTGTNVGDYLLLNGTTNGLYTFSTNSAPALVPGAYYFLGIQNTNSTPVAFKFQVDFDITPLPNGVPVSAALAAGGAQRYFYYDVNPGETAIDFKLYDLTDDVSLVVRKGSPFPTPADFTFGSFNPGITSEEIIIATNSSPVALSPGRWYLGVFNAAASAVNGTILATAYTSPIPDMVVLQNGVPHGASNPGTGATNDYYRFVVGPSAVRAQFEIVNATGDLTLLARKGLLPPDLNSYDPLRDLINARQGMLNEMILLYDFTLPIPLTPGEWYLTVANTSGRPVSYNMLATTWDVRATNFVVIGQTIVGNSLCLTWTSEPGIHYYIEGKTDLNSTNWVTVSPVLTATDVTTTYCITLPSSLSIFRVRQGLPPVPAPAPTPLLPRQQLQPAVP